MCLCVAIEAPWCQSLEHGASMCALRRPRLRRVGRRSYLMIGTEESMSRNVRVSQTLNRFLL
jgi:hypothetical protein